MSLWNPDPCVGDAGWTGETVCRRPYGLDGSNYGRGPYGRCAIVGGADWGEGTVTMSQPLKAAPRAATPWRRRRG
jgi:hypothetical protein